MDRIFGFAHHLAQQIKHNSAHKILSEKQQNQSFQLVLFMSRALSANEIPKRSSGESSHFGWFEPMDPAFL